MDLRTESLDFNTFLLFICLFLSADRQSPHEAHRRSCDFLPRSHYLNCNFLEVTTPPRFSIHNTMHYILL